MRRYLEVFARFLRLGCIAFGGPIAHLGYFEREFVERAAWLDREAYAEMVALCTVLPGPTSSQVGMLLGATRAGPLGGVVAWIGFTTPSAIALASVGYALRTIARGRAYAYPHPRLVDYAAVALDGIAAVAVAVVSLAVISLARTLLSSSSTRLVAVASFGIALFAATHDAGFGWLALAFGGVAGLAFCSNVEPIASKIALRVPVWAGALCLVILIACSTAFGLDGRSETHRIASPSDEYVRLFEVAFRSGSFVFGGGHVVLSFLASLQNAVEIPAPSFRAGYGIVQATPGPLFSFAALLGAADEAARTPWLGAATALLGIFLPSFLILPAALSLWNSFRTLPRAGAALAGLSASVVGLLAATLVDPLATTFYASARGVSYVALACAFALLRPFRRQAWAVVLAVPLICMALFALRTTVPILHDVGMF